MDWPADELRSARWIAHARRRLRERFQTRVTAELVISDAVPYGEGAGGVHIWHSECGAYPVVARHHTGRLLVVTVLNKAMARATVRRRERQQTQRLRKALQRIANGCADAAAVARRALGQSEPS